ncbi:MAG: Gfo/Idh/MocA family oxidoreductase [Pirellulales bacterium]|nr:Gfo/Idh/MocA family oxidoreductase [Pirellulales bacterium]
MPLGFAIVGTGMISRFHARAINAVRGAKLIACCSQTAKRAQAFAEEVGCTPYHKMVDMLADSRIDVVTIATPSGAHQEPAVAAARAGRHVVVEKPLEITLQRCDRIIRECDKRDVKLATIFPSRFHKGAIQMKRAVDQGRFGRLTLGDAYVKWFRSQDYYDSGAWRGTWALDGGGALMNQAIHTVDLLSWLMGPVLEIQAQTATLAHKRIEVEDVATATVRFANGALGVIEATTAAFPGYLKRIELHGSQGSAVLEEEDIKAWDFAKEVRGDQAIRRAMSNRKSGGGGAADPAAIGHHPHTVQFRDFVRAIHADRTPAIDGHEGRKAVEIILAIYKAAHTGKTVKLPLKGR